MKPPKFFKELSFLIPYLNDEENRHSNIPRPDSYPHRSSSQSSFNSPEDDDSFLSELSLPVRTPTPKRRQYISTRTFSSPTDTSVTAASVLKEYLDSTKTQAASNSEPQPYSNSDNVIDFFITMAKTVKNFPVSKQLKIKAELFQMVHNVELEIMNESMFKLTNEPTGSYQASSTSLSSNVPLRAPDKTPIVIKSEQILKPPSHVENISRPVGNPQQPKNSFIPTKCYQAIPAKSHYSDVPLRVPNKSQIVIKSEQIFKPSHHNVNFPRQVGNLRQPNLTGSYQATNEPSTSHSTDELLTSSSAQQFADADESQNITSDDNNNEDTDETPLGYKLNDFVLF